jgi:uncharacterized repeat protein (TIGR01451 family)
MGDFVITVNSGGVSNTTLSSSASVSGAEADPDSTNNSDIETTFVGGVDLKLSKAADVSTLTPGSLLTYTLTYHNGGFITANGVKLSDILPANTVFDLAHSDAGWQDAMGNTLSDGATGTAVFPLGSLAVSDTGVSKIMAVRVNSTVPAGANAIDNSASIVDDGAGGADLTPSDNDASVSTTLTAAPDLTLTVAKHVFTSSHTALPVADNLNVVARGQIVEYTYSYSNVGNQAAAATAITATVPAGTHFDATHSNVSWSQIDATHYRFSLDSLAAGQDASTVIFAVSVDQARALTPPPVKAIASTATIDDAGTNGADATPVNNTATQSTTLFEGLYALSNSRFGGANGKGSLPVVRVFDVTTGIEAAKISAYENSYRDGVRVAIGDINGDGFVDIVTATRNGSGRIRVFDGLTHERINIGDLAQITAFSGRHAHGAYVALSDVNGDGRLDIVAGAGLGGDGSVRVFDGLNGDPLQTEAPFGSGYKGGVRVAGGDVDGDGRGDIIAGQGSLGSEVKVYFGSSDKTRTLSPNTLQFDGSNGTAPRLRDGIFIATGDTTGDGIAEVIVGRGKIGNTGGASVGIFKFGFTSPTVAIGGGSFTEIKTIPLSGKAYNYGARVAATDINFDGIADIVVGAGHIGGSRVQILDGLTGNELSSLTAFPASSRLGVFTAAGAAPIPIRLL